MARAWQVAIDSMRHILDVWPWCRFCLRSHAPAHLPVPVPPIEPCHHASSHGLPLHLVSAQLQARQSLVRLLGQTQGQMPLRPMQPLQLLQFCSD